GKILSNFLLLRYLKSLIYNSVAELRFIAFSRPIFYPIPVINPDESGKNQIVYTAIIIQTTTPVQNKTNSIIQHKYKQKGVPHIFIFPMQYEKHLFVFFILLNVSNNIYCQF
ncbi:hypothetical protein, partial [Bacteroides uniformis]|uniref:hypothetical protein n=1 Tax=Bacteroides uniformis TaxID=820 RepID=UPI001BB10BE5